MRKRERHRLITRLLNEQDVQKQEDFVGLLQERGVSVTQATISRDIKELKLVKVPAQSGGYRYNIPQETTEDVYGKLDKILKTAFVSIDRMDKFVILKTLPGNASALANLIEKQYVKELFATLNDDDNVLMITRTEEDTDRLFKDFQRYI